MRLSPITKEMMARLPASSQQKARVIEEQVDAAGALSSGTYERLTEIRKQQNRVQLQRQNLLGDRNVAEKHKAPRLRELDEELASLNDEIARVTARQDLSKASQQRSAGLLRAIALWLAALPQDMLLSEHSGSDKIKGDVTLDAIEKRRRRIRELSADLKRIDSAPYPAAVAKQAAREEIERLAEKGRPTVYQVVEDLETIGWPNQAVADGLLTKYVGDGVAYVNWLFRDQAIAAIEKEIEDQADDENALTDAQRSDAFKTVLGDRLASEREEEALIQAAHYNVDRRPDADPRAVLGLASALPGPKPELRHSKLIRSVETSVVDPVPPAPHQSGPRNGGPLNVGLTTPRPLEMDLVTKLLADT